MQLVLCNVKLQLSDVSHVEYWELSNILTNIAAAVYRQTLVNS